MFLRNKEKIEVIIGPETCVKGDLSSKGAVRIDGKLEGNLDADLVIVGETGLIKGNIDARGAIIDGRVEGNIRASELVEIKSNGCLKGDLFCQKLVIQEGGLFEGRSHMGKKEGEEKSRVIQFVDSQTE